MGQFLSIIVNNYNYGRFLRQCINSVLNQTVHADEVIVVDDGSTDESREIIASYGSRIRVVLKPNAGQASALNAGFAVSSGDWVWFVDADDWLREDAVERALAACEENCERLSFLLSTVGPGGEVVGHESGSEHGNGNIRPIDVFAGGGFYYAVPTSGNVYRRDFLDTIMPIPEEPYRISADLYLTYANLGHQRVKLNQIEVGYYRVHGANHFHLPSQFISEHTLLQKRVTAYWQICDLVYRQLSNEQVTENSVEKFMLNRLPMNALKHILVWYRLGGDSPQIHASLPMRSDAVAVIAVRIRNMTHFAKRTKEHVIYFLLRFAPVASFGLLSKLEKLAKSRRNQSRTKA